MPDPLPQPVLVLVLRPLRPAPFLISSLLSFHYFPGPCLRHILLALAFSRPGCTQKPVLLSKVSRPFPSPSPLFFLSTYFSQAKLLLRREGPGLGNTVRWTKSIFSNVRPAFRQHSHPKPPQRAAAAPAPPTAGPRVFSSS